MESDKAALAVMKKMFCYLSTYQHLLPLPRTELAEMSKIIYNFEIETNRQSEQIKGS